MSGAPYVGIRELGVDISVAARPGILQRLERLRDGKRVIQFRSQADVDRFFEQLPAVNPET